MSLSIPEIHLPNFIQGNLSQRQATVSTIGTAFEEVGFLAVSGHNVDQSVISDFYRILEEFFALPTELKRQYEIPALHGQRGYTSFGKEHAKGSISPDLKEFWQIGQPSDSQLRNIDVPELAHFLEISNQLFIQFEAAGKAILQAIALFLDLEETYFDQYIANGNSILRAIHYPPILSEPQSAIRAEAHEDINLITLLVGASADGLELLDRSGSWKAISAPEGYIIVNVGDMLQRLTNNRLRSTTHRVVNPPKAKWHSHRYSIPFFLHPISAMQLDCLDNCIDASNPIQYEPITAGDYLMERLREIGLVK